MASGIKALSTEPEAARLSPRQAIAMGCPAKEVLYGGKKGGGKSYLLIMRCVPLLAEADRKWKATGIGQEKCLVVYFRKNLDNLRGLIAEAKTHYPRLPYGAEWNGTEKTFRFRSGAQVVFRHLDGPDDHEGWNGVEIAGLGFDQVEDIPFKQYKFLVAQVRSSDTDYERLKFVLATANPGGRHADWVYKYFIEPHPAGNKILRATVKIKGGTESRTYTRAFIPAELSDNPYLYDSGEYEANLRSLPEYMQRWYIDGDWTSTFSGYFAGILRPEVSFIDSFSINPGWEMGLSIDWGERSPACALVAARDQDGRVFFIDEIYEPGITGRIFGAKMLRMFSEQKWSDEKRWRPDEVPGVIDPSAAWEHSARKGRVGSSIPEAISSYGFRLFPAQNDRVGGWRQMSERMIVEKGHENDRWPCSFYVFRDRCPHLCNELLRIMPDSKNNGDVDTNMADHAIDAARYRLLDWPITWRSAEDDEDEDLRRWLEIARKPDALSSPDMTTGYGD